MSFSEFIIVVAQYNNTEPATILKLLNTLLESLDHEITTLSKTLSLDLDVPADTEQMIEHIIEASNYTLQAGGMAIPAGYLASRDLFVNSSIYKPTIIKSDTTEIEGKNIHLNDTVFITNAVILTCSDRLYIENNDFGNATLIINDRILTTKEQSHISVNVLKKCPILEMKIVLYIDPKSMPNVKDLREGAAEETNLKETMLDHIDELMQERSSFASNLDNIAGDITTCSVNFIPKIIDIPCTGVDSFDFFSV